MQEIERRWIIKDYQKDAWPSDYKRKTEITQGYIGRNLRVRVEDARPDVPTADLEGFKTYTLTHKSGQGLVREEREEYISGQVAAMLLEDTKYKIRKTRYRFADGWEHDIFHDKLAGLEILEREFASPEEARAAVLPEWVGSAVEVTESLTNRQLARAAMFFDQLPTTTSVQDAVLNELQARHRITRIVLTGAPCSGKSTALKTLRENDQLHCVPETATLLMSQISVQPSIGRMNFQYAIRTLQTSFEDAAMKQAILQSKRGIVLDRGTLDSAAFVGGKNVYEAMFRTGENEDFSRYDAVIMISLPPKEVYEREKHNNPVRRETYEEAKVVENDLRAIWSGHPNFIFIDENESWDNKLNKIIVTITNLTNGSAKETK